MGNFTKFRCFCVAFEVSPDLSWVTGSDQRLVERVVMMSARTEKPTGAQARELELVQGILGERVVMMSAMTEKPTGAQAGVVEPERRFSEA